MPRFLHQIPDVKQLFEVVAKEQQVLPLIVEKDYWIMHCLWGLQQQGYTFELKGGTSLSKGFDIIDRFSEDIDIQIHPRGGSVKIGKHHDKPSHVESRRVFFNAVAEELTIPGLQMSRDQAFDDIKKMRSAGIRAEYTSCFPGVEDIKQGVLLELGFDQTTPNVLCTISSWAFEKLKLLDEDVVDNRARDVPCYCPEYTFVEKLQTISTKYRLQQQSDQMPINFLRHYYDVYQLLASKRVIEFIGTEAYQKHKARRFRQADKVDIKNNPAFSIPEQSVRDQYSRSFEKKSAMYFKGQPSFNDILSRIEGYLAVL